MFNRLFFTLPALFATSVLAASGCDEIAAEPQEAPAQAPLVNAFPSPPPAEDLVCRAPLEEKGPWSVTFSRNLSQSADFYERILANDPRYANPADPQTRTLRHRLLTRRVFSESLNEFNQDILGRR